MKDLEEMKVHNVCLKMMQEEASIKEKPLTETFIRTLHQTMLREDYTVYRQLPGGVNTSYVVHAGCYKTRPNSVITPSGERFEYASPEETPALMADLVAWYNQVEQERSMSPVELAALFHYRYIRIHPFEYGNGRIARLLMNYTLTKHGYQMLVIRSKTKKNYLDALRKADKQVGPIPSDGAHATLEQANAFVAYFSHQMEDTIENNLRYIGKRADSVWWYDGELITFKNETTIKILKEMDANPKITIVGLSKLLLVSENAVQKQIKNLQEKGYIQRVGSIRGGSWQVLLVCTT